MDPSVLNQRGSRRVFVILWRALVLTRVLCGVSLGAVEAPNFILVYVDDLGWTDTSLEMVEGRTDTASDFYQTPNLERLALEGIVFSSAYSPAPVCTPSRNALLHGMTPARLLNSTLDTRMAKTTRRGEITIPKALKMANPGYVTAHFGKWHIPFIEPSLAGYDVSDGATGNGEGDFQDDMKTPLPKEDLKRIESLTRKGKSFIQEQVDAERPFFLQLSHYAVHIWHASREETREKYRQLPRPEKASPRDYLSEEDISESAYKHDWLLNYAAMIDELDESFGDLLDYLDEVGISKNTYVIFSSDNGGGLRGNNPLRGSKADLTEGGIRVPLVIRGPGIEKATYCETPVVGWDLLPTLYALAGGAEALPADLDGANISPLLFGAPNERARFTERALVFHFPWYNGEPESAIRVGRYKLLKNLDSGDTALYDVVDDLSERKNLKSALPEKAALLERGLEEYLDGVGAETVNQLRTVFLEKIEGSWLTKAEERVERLKKAVTEGDATAVSKLAEAERYVAWLEEQLIFTRERMRRNEEPR